MGSLSRAVIVGTLALPLAFAGAGLASATDDVCSTASCNWSWDHDTTVVTDDDQSAFNTGISG